VILAVLLPTADVGMDKTVTCTITCRNPLPADVPALLASDDTATVLMRCIYTPYRREFVKFEQVFVRCNNPYLAARTTIAARGHMTHRRHLCVRNAVGIARKIPRTPAGMRCASLHTMQRKRVGILVDIAYAKMCFNGYSGSYCDIGVCINILIRRLG